MLLDGKLILPQAVNFPLDYDLHRDKGHKTRVSLSATVKYMVLSMLPSSPYLAGQPFWTMIFLEKTGGWPRRVISMPPSIIKLIQMISSYPIGAQGQLSREDQSEFYWRQSGGSVLLEDSLVTKIKLSFWRKREMAKQKKWKNPFHISWHHRIAPC